MKKIFSYLNPIEHLGERDYSIAFPILLTFSSAVILELFAHNVAKNPHSIDLMAIFWFIGLIIYLAFRKGIRGGLITTLVTILYYFYLIFSREYAGQELVTSIETTFILAVVYLLMGFIIGWLKQTIDNLIESESDEKKRLQTIVQQLPVGIIITDNKGVVVQANKQVHSLLGVRVPVGYQIGKNTLVESKHNNEVVSPSQSPIIEVLLTGKSIEGKEYSIKRKDGKKMDIQLNASVVRNKGGKIIAAASIFSDITEQKEMEERKDDFVNMASHELKTPVTSIKLYLQLLQKQIGNQDTKATKIVANIKTQTERLQKLINDLLDVSRLQTGKLSFTKEKFRLDSLITEAVNALTGTTINQKIIYSHKKPLTVVADKFRIYQVITNLITNAIKYSGEGKMIKINAYQQNKKAVVSVQDLGIGIDKSQQKRIFERLYQVVDDEAKTFPGFGMGLYISKEIVNKHKGTIWVESTPNKGSTFYFSLPINNE